MLGLTSLEVLEQLIEVVANRVHHLFAKLPGLSDERIFVHG
jgi:hypothetical protein